MFCKACDTEKPEEDFPKNKGKASGRGFYCNACMYERLKAWRAKNPQKVRDMQKKRYERKHGTSTPVCPE